MAHSGQVFIIPPSPTEEGDQKFRPHVLLRDCDADTAMASFAFASTQMTEARYGAQNVLVNPAATAYAGSGFSQPTYVYPSRLVAVNPDDLDTPVGRVIDEMPLIRTALRKALGLGTGTAVSGGQASGSHRGHFVVLSNELSTELGASLAVIMTEPIYSIQERFQIVIPVLSGAEYEYGELDVPILEGTAQWLAQVDKKYENAFFWTEAVFSLFHHREIRQYSKLPLDEGTLRDLERALEIFFQI
ncbi:MAG: hypothetical protein SFU57_03845 [Gemmatimonadales bacterium]|nr:hypothetical protein [Gemmatimonadales bacterium]